MSWLSDLTGIDVNLGQMWDDVTGVTGAEAAKEAALLQSNAATSAAEQTRLSVQDQIAAQQAAAAQSRQDLQPFTDFGASFINPAQQAVGQSQELFNNPMSIMSNPMFQALQDDTRRQNLQNAAVRGRMGTGGTLAGLEQSSLRTGFDILNSERQAQLQNAGFLSNLVGMGQSAAAGQGATSMQAGQGISNTIGQGNLTVADLLTGAAAAQAGGVVGAANSQVAGTGNLIGMGTSGISGGIGDTLSKIGLPKLGTSLNPTQVATLPGQTYGR